MRGKSQRTWNLRNHQCGRRCDCGKRYSSCERNRSSSLHLCHCSTKDSVKMVQYCKKGWRQCISGEVCPHHFAMTEDEIAGDDANYKMNPPLRSAADVEALVDGLADGTMEAISTDHAPHGEEEKKQSIAKAPFGIVGSETAYALSVTHLVKTGKLTPLQLVEKMSTNPCRILSVPGRNTFCGGTGGHYNCGYGFGICD